MNKKNPRIWALLALALIITRPFSIFAAQAVPLSLVKSVPDLVIGNPDAPLSIIEYSSFTCNHCANFHKEVLPKIKKKYIDTGKVKLIFRHFPIDGMAVKAYAIFMQVPLPLQFDILEKIFEKQGEWLNENYIDHLSKICKVPKDQAIKFSNNKDLENSILMKRLEAEKAYKINATPYFIINGRVIDHAPSFEDLEAILSPIGIGRKGSESMRR